ncbi:MAG: hypothetical protein JHC57_10140, partial [Sphingopyxis sp.]|nr:hypothetical protein [Sphingopyxis sp.]
IANSARVAASLSASEVASGKRDFDKFLRLAPEKAGEIIVAAAERRRSRVLVGSDAKLAALIERIAPVSYWRFIGRGM